MTDQPTVDAVMEEHWSNHLPLGYALTIQRSINRANALLRGKAKSPAVLYVAVPTGRLKAKIAGLPIQDLRYAA